MLLTATEFLLDNHRAPQSDVQDFFTAAEKPKVLIDLAW